MAGVQQALRLLEQDAHHSHCRVHCSPSLCSSLCRCQEPPLPSLSSKTGSTGRVDCDQRSATFPGDVGVARAPVPFIRCNLCCTCCTCYTYCTCCTCFTYCTCCTYCTYCACCTYCTYCTCCACCACCTCCPCYCVLQRVCCLPQSSSPTKEPLSLENVEERANKECDV